MGTRTAWACPGAVANPCKTRGISIELHLIGFRNVLQWFAIPPADPEGSSNPRALLITLFLRYVTTRCREMVGPELLGCQSLFMDMSTLLKFPDAVLRDLAGNAFEASCCAATTYVQCTVLGFIQSGGFV
eukprot:12390330-Alexandrium_andersonii.AAC.1